VQNSVNILFSPDLAVFTDMKASGELLLLFSMACLFFLGETVSQGVFPAFCNNYKEQAGEKKSDPKIHKSVCSTDGQTNHCLLCKASKDRNFGILGFKNEGKC
uniref:Kazal-like domain-containing protein n=1 Tax=Jaculus jaculus TaxID=51337 RepID=A0A8C5KGQ2_JACJA